MQYKLLEIKVFQRESKGLFSHPKRYKYINCWSYKQDNNIYVLVNERSAKFSSGKCQEFFDDEAEIVGEIDRSREFERDRFELITEESE